MFTLLSNQKELTTLLSNNIAQTHELICDNLKLLIKLLNDDVSQLLENRKKLGVILSLDKDLSIETTKEALTRLSLEELLSQKSHLIAAINTLCLAEAIVVRNNFIDCLDNISHDISPTLSLVTEISSDEKANDTSTGMGVNDVIISNNTTIKDKNNVSPIRLTQIKQRLAQAAKESELKKETIKNKLNKLLLESSNKADPITSKLA